MKIFFMRHAEAEDGPVDATRALTVKGRRDARAMGRFFRRADLVFDYALTSPLVRAQQTAEEVLKQCPMERKKRLVRSRALLNDAGVTALTRSLAKMSGDANILLVGHEPSLSAHVRRFLGMDRGTSLPLSKGAVARVDVDAKRPKEGTLRLLIGPKQLS
jgi:phosphohistidine phosphatase